ncbi:hypothetical protein CDD83_7985 [Cordyceps sp. RAO-2017]|nr:hypothetical protein CDD83_7985 [Cordyceps sp. RAO-2017]
MALTNGQLPKTQTPADRDRASGASSSAISHRVDSFKPFVYFFYGTLMDPEVLQTVTALREPPRLREASIGGFEMKIWGGRYPTLLRQRDPQGRRIEGKAWRATTLDQCLRLQQYETAAYQACTCTIQFLTGEVVQGLTFKWAGDPTSSELSEGSFDLETWQREQKPLMS